MKKAKTPLESEVQARYLVMPHEANVVGTAFGGVVMSWIDMAAAMAAQRHAEAPVVTASIDGLSFRAPILIGDHVILLARVNYVGTTSMEVGVRVMRENPYTGVSVRATTAYTTFVQIGQSGKPEALIGLDPETEDDQRRFENARIRAQARRELRSRIKSRS